MKLAVQGDWFHKFTRPRGRSLECLHFEQLAVHDAEEVEREEGEQEPVNAISLLVLLTPIVELMVIDLQMECDREGDGEE